MNRRVEGSAEMRSLSNLPVIWGVLVLVYVEGWLRADFGRVEGAVDYEDAIVFSGFEVGEYGFAGSGGDFLRGWVLDMWTEGRRRDGLSGLQCLRGLPIPSLHGRSLQGGERLGVP